MSDATDRSTTPIAPTTPTQDRRSFLTTLGGAALAAGGMGIFGCATRPNGSATSGESSRASGASASGGGAAIAPIGLQLYTVRDEMKRDMAATLAHVARIGYKEVEFAGYFDRTPEQVRAMLDANGLRAPSAHIPLQMIQSNPAAVIAAAKTIGHEYVIHPYVDEKSRGTTIAAWRDMARAMNDAGAQLASSGLKFGYHNHDFEFPLVEGKMPYEILVSETDPRYVVMEMDLYWATKAGQDPLAWFAKYPGRFQLVHVKDSRGAPNNEMTPVGSGTIDWKRIFAQRAQAGIQHYIVEHDSAADYAGGAFASIESSYNYLSKLRV